MTDAILVNLEASVLTLTFNRPEKKNALNTAMYAALANAMNEAANDDAVRVLVLQGSADCFTAGNDLADFVTQLPALAAAGDTMPTGDAIPPVFQFLLALNRFPKPMLAAVCGPAVGIGTTMLLHCDMAYAGDNAAFSMPFVNLGVCVEGGASVLLAQHVGNKRAAEKLLLGEAFYADEALEMGLINRILPPTEVNGYTQAQAQKLAARPASSLRATKALMKRNVAHIDAVMTDEFQQFAKLLKGPAAQEAITAVMQKRKPDFSTC